MELLPGTYTFHFRDAGTVDLTFSGCDYEVTAATDALVVPVQYKMVSYNYNRRTKIFSEALKVRLRNLGAEKIYNVHMSLSSWPPNNTILDGDVSFPDIPAGAAVWSNDTFYLQIDLGHPADPSLGTTWNISYEDAGGTLYLLFNIPQ